MSLSSAPRAYVHWFISLGRNLLILCFGWMIFSWDGVVGAGCVGCVGCVGCDIGTGGITVMDTVATLLSA